MRQPRLVAVAFLLLFGVAGCDLDVANTNNPDREGALVNASDVEALVSGSWWQWYLAQHDHGISVAPMLSTMSFQHSAYPANFGMVNYSSIPRNPTRNVTSDADYANISNMWTRYYRAIAAVNTAFQSMNAGAVDLGDDEARARAFGRFVQGISHGSIAMLHVHGPIVDENSELSDAGGTPLPQEYVSPQELLAAAIDFLDDAIAISEANTFYVPVDWFGSVMDPALVSDPDGGNGLPSALLAKMASSYKAMLTVAVARSPQDAQQINWNTVLDYIDDGVDEDVRLVFAAGTRWFGSLYYSLLNGWSQMSYFVHGMADQSGKYQEWMSLPVSQRHPNLASGPFLVITPDQRFPQGATVAAQQDDLRPYPEQRFRILPTPGDQWARDDRGTWRWSYYRDRRVQGWGNTAGTWADYVSVREQRLLAAEAHYRLGNLGAAADIINETRVAAGLNATNAAGLNTSCVPRLPDNSCGDLWEMLKWERRLEVSHQGTYIMNTMYFDSRRWGDLMQGTITNWPVPCRDAQLEGQQCDQFGGSLEWGAPLGTYGY